MISPKRETSKVLMALDSWKANLLIFIRIIGLLRPHWVPTLGAVISMVLSTGFALIVPWLLAWVIDTGLRHGQFSSLLLATGAILVTSSLRGLCAYGQGYLSQAVSNLVAYDLRNRLYDHLQTLSFSFHDEAETGQLMSRLTVDIEAVRNFIPLGLLRGLVALVTFSAVTVILFRLDWHLAMVTLICLPILVLLSVQVGRRLRPIWSGVQNETGALGTVMQESLSGMRVVKAFAREDYELRRLEEESLEGVEINLRARGLKAKLTPIVQIIVAVGTCLVLWFGTRMVLSTTLSAGSLIVFILYLGKMYKPMQELSKMTDAYSKAAVGYERIQEVLQTDKEVKDLPRSRPAPRFRGQIEFEHVHFYYTQDTPILKDVSFKVEAGQVAALVGPTGAGKTTIISLIPRFYDPISGTVKIDGTDIKEFRQKSLRQQISFVLQETVLFHAPVWQNIAYGKPEATRGEILKAAELANASEFVEKLPDGYNTVLGERGMTLSGGQRQRIAIARAIIRNTPILILDEPTSDLDASSEKLVFEALDRLMEGKTTIVIAHRLSTVRKADMIFVVKDGDIVETGKHDDLSQRGGLYSELYRLQYGEQSEVEAPASH